jgi:hypothetical protein
VKRVRQESSEFYVVTAREIAEALGLYASPDDEVLLHYNGAGEYEITISTHVTESVNIDIPSLWTAVKEVDEAIQAAKEITVLTDGWEDPWDYPIPVQG